MRYFIPLLSGLALVTLQTALIPRLGIAEAFFDLLLPWVVYLAAFRTLHDSLPIVVFMGVLVDHLSGGPFGLYLTSYVWLFAAVRLAAMVVRADNPMMLVFAVVLAVAFQNAVFVLALGLGGAAERFGAGEAVRLFGEQLGWALLAGPPAAAAMRYASRLASRRERRSAAALPVPE